MSKVFELKVFKNGGSNAVRIPSSINVRDGKLFLVLGDDGSMTLETSNPVPMARFFALLDQGKPADVASTLSEGEFQRAAVGKPDRSWMDELEAAFVAGGEAK